MRFITQDLALVGGRRKLLFCGSSLCHDSSEEWAVNAVEHYDVLISGLQSRPGGWVGPGESYCPDA